MATSKKGVAVLDDGRKLTYQTRPIGDGATKEVFLTADRHEVVCFYKDADPGRDAARREHLKAIMTCYNPTTVSPQASEADQAAAVYYRDLFRWPTDLVTSPRPGFVAPAIAPRFVFGSAPPYVRGRPKAMTYFTMPNYRRIIAEAAPKLLGDLRGDLLACQALARAVMRLNQEGLGHGDLSPNNVMVDPSSGKVCLIDLDGLVVPGLFSAPVLGTKGFIPPEVVAQLNTFRPKPLVDVNADQHALAVLIYQFLLHRHPLDGRQIPAADTAEEQEQLAYGRDALFCEHPDDDRNRPEGDGYVPCAALGPDLAGLFRRAFVDGLHAPDARPTALEWLDALIKAGDMLRPCAGPECLRRWFVVTGPGSITCSFCRTAASGPTPTLALLDEVRGRRVVARRLVVRKGLTLHRWHVEAGVGQGPAVDARPLARISPDANRWRLINLGPGTLALADGRVDRLKGSVTLKDGMELRLSSGPSGRLARFEFF